MNDQELLRYSRHILLPQVDIAGQTSIQNARVLVVGIGGLGSPVAMYLASAGIGALVLVDDDQVDESNLQRQVIHPESRLGDNKAESACDAVTALNSQCEVEAVCKRLTDAELEQYLQKIDIVADCSDNLATRRQLNRLCRQNKTPLVFASAIRFEGQLSVFDFRRDDSPCYECLYGDDVRTDESCSANGIFSPVAGVVGSSQALEVLKIAADVGKPLVGTLGIFDGMKNQWRYMGLSIRQGCGCRQ